MVMLSSRRAGRSIVTRRRRPVVASTAAASHSRTVWWAEVVWVRRHADRLSRAQSGHVLSRRWWRTEGGWSTVIATRVAKSRCPSVRRVVLQALHREGDPGAVAAAAHRDHVLLDAVCHELSLLVVTDVQNVVDLPKSAYVGVRRCAHSRDNCRTGPKRCR